MATEVDFGDLAEALAKAAEPQDDVTFPWFGKKLRVHPMAGDTAYIDFVERAGHLDDNDPAAGIAVKEFMREMVHEEDFDDFWTTGRQHRIGSDMFFQVATKIIEAVSGHPTEQSSTSRGGLHAIGSSSTAGRSSQAYAKVRADLEAEGRPELALVYLEAEEALEQRAV